MTWTFPVYDNSFQVRVRRTFGGFTASVWYGQRHPGRYITDPYVVTYSFGHSVLGTYPTVAAARAAAVDMLAMAAEPRLCSWRDVKEARKVRREIEQRQVTA